MDKGQVNKHVVEAFLIQVPVPDDMLAGCLETFMHVLTTQWNLSDTEEIQTVIHALRDETRHVSPEQKYSAYFTKKRSAFATWLEEQRCPEDQTTLRGATLQHNLPTPPPPTAPPDAGQRIYKTFAILCMVSETADHYELPAEYTQQMRTDLTGRQAHTNQEVLDCIHTPLSGVKADMDNWKKICCLYGIPYVCLRDQRATWSNILATLNHFGVMTACDQILLVLCGHGIPAAGDRPYGWFCCYDKPMTYNQMKGTLQQGQQGDHPRKVAFFIDVCFAGRATVGDGVQWRGRGKKPLSKKTTAVSSPTTQASEPVVTPSSPTTSEEFSMHHTKDEILSFVKDNYPLHGFEMFTAVEVDERAPETPLGGLFTKEIAKVLLRPDLLSGTYTTLTDLQELMRSRETLGSAKVVSVPTAKEDEGRNEGQFQFMYSLNSVTGYATEELGRQADRSFFQQNGIHTAELVKELLDHGYGPHQQDIDVLRLGNDIDLKVYCSTEDERNALSIVINPRRRGLHTEPDLAPDATCDHAWMTFRPGYVSAQFLGYCYCVNALHCGRHAVPQSVAENCECKRSCQRCYAVQNVPFEKLPALDELETFKSAFKVPESVSDFWAKQVAAKPWCEAVVPTMREVLLLYNDDPEIPAYLEKELQTGMADLGKLILPKQGTATTAQALGWTGTQVLAANADLLRDTIRWLHKKCAPLHRNKQINPIQAAAVAAANMRDKEKREREGPVSE
eukprot:TRINITY_DN67931_c7_g1_i6.p1 TRINITY_DN67931_c7_g1~~TRINITY_DN67931_c7_g1_i6.p1  ORF type:complete len:747 (-),score=42.22 TRINITY_DN67931_c7_g1_i6:266-2464(-)